MEIQFCDYCWEDQIKWLAYARAFEKDWLMEVEQQLKQHRMIWDTGGSRSPSASLAPTDSQAQLACPRACRFLPKLKDLLCYFPVVLKLFWGFP